MLLLHDPPKDPILEDKFNLREEQWLLFAKKWLENNNAFTIEDITKLLCDLREYVSLDYPHSKILPDEAIFWIADNITRIAIWFSESNENRFDLNYPTSKLTAIFVRLFKYRGYEF